ncbi:MAG TPA: SDR family oxidoreductase [Bryobacteraceae bacterium]
MSRPAVEPRQADEVRFADYDRIAPGDRAHISKTIREEDVAGFAALTGDDNPLHMSDSFASQTQFRRRVAHGMLTASYVSTLVGTALPGAGALWVEQSFRWAAPVFIGDRLEISAIVKSKSQASRAVTLEVQAVNQLNNPVLTGQGTVILLEERKERLEPGIADRAALITGGARGIGAAIAAALAEAGAAVAIQFRTSSAQAERLCEEIRNSGGRAFSFAADVKDAAAITAGIEEAANRFGKPVDVLINNAGSPPGSRPFADCGWDDVQEAIDVHVKPAFQCTKAVAPAMIAQKSGRIVNVGSVLTWGAPGVNDASFLLAKAALKALTKSLASELGPHGIRVNMVSPGLTETESAMRIPERLRKVQAMQTLLRRLCAPEDIAQTVLWLCSEGGAFISGADIPVCGGSVM